MDGHIIQKPENATAQKGLFLLMMKNCVVKPDTLPLTAPVNKSFVRAVRTDKIIGDVDSTTLHAEQVATVTVITAAEVFAGQRIVRPVTHSKDWTTDGSGAVENAMDV